MKESAEHCRGNKLIVCGQLSRQRLHIQLDTSGTSLRVFLTVYYTEYTSRQRVLFWIRFFRFQECRPRPLPWLSNAKLQIYARFVDFLHPMGRALFLLIPTYRSLQWQDYRAGRTRRTLHPIRRRQRPKIPKVTPLIYFGCLLIFTRSSRRRDFVNS